MLLMTRYNGVIPQNSQLGALDTAMIADFSSNFATINQSVIDNAAASQLAPPPLPPDPSSKVFFRLAVNAKLDSDFDGIPDVLECQNGNSSSFSHDSDGDGFSDGAENDQGTNPNDANDKPEIEALIVTGNAEAGVEISQKRKIIIPAGSPNRLIVVALQSDEYPSYTSGDLCEGECPFNDQLRWLITLSNGEIISGQVDVNDLHEKWETESDTFLGRSPVYFQEVKVVESKPDQDVVVEVEVGATNIEDGALPSTVMVGLVPVEVKVNGTIKEEDDLVAVSKGTDEDLATDFSVKVSGMGGLTADLKVKGTDGGIKFKDQTLTLTDGVEAKTKLWGTSPSSDKDKTIIEITLKKGSEELGKIEEEVTVFKGAKLEFEGNYYINVDTREFARRPWDGRVDPKPNSKGSLTGNTGFMSADIGASPTAGELASFKKAVDQSFSFGYQSAISFKQGDNSEIPKYKPWKDKLEVKITKVMSKQPSFEIKDDEMVDALLELKKGVLDGLPDGNEQLIDPEVKIGDYLIFDKTSVTTRISEKAAGAPSVTAAQVTAQINAQRGSGYDELLDYYMRAVGTPPAPWRPTVFAGFSHRRFEWKNDSFEVQKGTKIKDSFAAKAIRGEKENGGKLEVKWIFTGWNEFKFQGDLDDAVIETK